MRGTSITRRGSGQGLNTLSVCSFLILCTKPVSRAYKNRSDVNAFLATVVSTTFLNLIQFCIQCFETLLFFWTSENQEEHSGSIWPCLLFDFILFQIYLSDWLETIFKCTGKNVESTDVVIHFFWNLHSQNYCARKLIWKQTGFLKKKYSFFSL